MQLAANGQKVDRAAARSSLTTKGSPAKAPDGNPNEDGSTGKRSRSMIPQFVKVQGSSDGADRKIQEFLQPLVGKPIDPPMLNTYLTRLTGIGRSSSASYDLTQNDSKVGLLVTVQEKNYAPPVLNPSWW